MSWIAAPTSVIWYMQDEVGRRETVEEGRSRGNYDAEDLEEDVSKLFLQKKKIQNVLLCY